jgi:HPt (histidine-containing phosphotransfer) domain-containing protein
MHLTPSRIQPEVDLQRLSEIGEDDPAVMRQLADLYLEQADETRQKLQEAIKVGSAKEAQFLAHRWSGASSTCGMPRLLVPLQELELRAKRGQLSGASELFAQASRELERVRQWLAVHLVGPQNPLQRSDPCLES